MFKNNYFFIKYFKRKRKKFPSGHIWTTICISRVGLGLSETKSRTGIASHKDRTLQGKNQPPSQTLDFFVTIWFSIYMKGKKDIPCIPEGKDQSVQANTLVLFI